MPEHTIEVTVVDLPLFARLVKFLEEVESHAHSEVDLTLKEMVDECRDDLLREVS
jgi:hypothetical protein